MVSMKDVAAACGVSVATVSKALSDTHDIGEKTKKLVRETAEKMGYFPNQSARYLKTNRSYNIGVLFEDAAGSGLTHDFFSGVLQSLKKTVEAKGYDLSFLNTTSSKMSYVERAKYRGFDGVVIVCCLDYNQPRVTDLLQSNVKVITIDYVTDNRTAILSGNTEGMHSLMEYLISKGHTKIAYICGDQNSVTRQRLAAYYRSMEEHRISVPEQYVQYGLYRDLTKAYEMTETLLDLKDPPTCILYSDDVASFGGINAIKARGLSIPDDISVVGYDGVQAAQYEEPRLTTYAQDRDEMGKLAALKLIEEIEHPMTTIPSIVTVQGKLVEGQTVKDLTKK